MFTNLKLFELWEVNRHKHSLLVSYLHSKEKDIDEFPVVKKLGKKLLIFAVDFPIIMKFIKYHYKTQESEMFPYILRLYIFNGKEDLLSRGNGMFHRPKIPSFHSSIVDNYCSVKRYLICYKTNF